MKTNEAKHVRGLPEFLREQQLEYEISCYNETVAELSRVFADSITFWLASIPTAAEATEVDLRPDDRLGGILPYRKKFAIGTKYKIQIYKCKFLEPRGNIWWIF